MEALRLLRVPSAAAILLILMISAAFSLDMGSRMIDAARLREMQVQGAGLWLIDVRGPRAYEESHIEGAVNIPSNALPFKKFSPGKTLVIVDDSLGSNVALQAADTLVKSGHERVYLLEGGLAAWRSAKFPVAGTRPDRPTGVTAGELKAAVERKVSLRIFDLRTNAIPMSGSLPGMEQLDGKNQQDKLRRLTAIMSAERRNELQNTLARRKTTILVFSASDDAAAIMDKTFPGSKDDLRYLIGGQESLAANKAEMRGGCKTCPGK